MNTLMSKLLPVVLIGLVTVFMISSTGFAAMQSANSSQCNTLAQESSHGIKYMSGGIGLDQRRLINKEDLSKGYDLKLVFAKKNGEYISNVKVMIESAGHRVFVDSRACNASFDTYGYPLQKCQGAKGGHFQTGRYRTLVNTQACGPWFYTKLPRGQYRIIVSHDGISESRNVTLGNGFKTEMFRWS
jgi:hypothetical protein